METELGLPVVFTLHVHISRKKDQEEQRQLTQYVSNFRFDKHLLPKLRSEVYVKCSEISMEILIYEVTLKSSKGFASSFIKLGH